jgi:hypothetical protein
VNVEQAKAYEQAVMARPEFAAMAEAVSKSLYELCNRSNTEEAYHHGEWLRRLIIGWMGMAVDISFECGQKDASGKEPQ